MILRSAGFVLARRHVPDRSRFCPGSCSSKLCKQNEGTKDRQNADAPCHMQLSCHKCNASRTDEAMATAIGRVRPDVISRLCYTSLIQSGLPARVSIATIII